MREKIKINPTPGPSPLIRGRGEDQKLDNAMFGNMDDYKRFINGMAKKHLKGFDKFVYLVSRWNGMLYKAVYDLWLKDKIITKTTPLRVREMTLYSLLYVKIYGKIYWYDNQLEKRKFKKWVKGN